MGLKLGSAKAALSSAGPLTFEGRVGFDVPFVDGDIAGISASLQAGGGMVAVPAGPHATIVHVTGAEGGELTVTPTPGAAPLRSIDVAGRLPKPRITTTVRRAEGGRHALTVTASRLGGRRLIVREVGPRGETQELLRMTRPGTRRVTFTAADGRAGRRRIEGVLDRDHRQEPAGVLATFRAAAPRPPGRPRKVRIRRRGGRATVTWGAATGAQGYRVLARVSDGRRIAVPTTARRRRATIRGLGTGDRVRVAVHAIRRNGLEGRTRNARYTVPKPKPRRAKRR